MNGQQIIEGESALNFARRLAVTAPPCQIGAHDTCDQMTESFNAANPENAGFVCHCSCHMDRTVAQRDSARGLAAALKHQNAEALRVAREALNRQGPLRGHSMEVQFEDGLDRIVAILGPDYSGAPVGDEGDGDA